jgi:hypothetical protein
LSFNDLSVFAHKGHIAAKNLAKCHPALANTCVRVVSSEDDVLNFIGFLKATVKQETAFKIGLSEAGYTMINFTFSHRFSYVLIFSFYLITHFCSPGADFLCMPTAISNEDLY